MDSYVFPARTDYRATKEYLSESGSTATPHTGLHSHGSALSSPACLSQTVTFYYQQANHRHGTPGKEVTTIGGKQTNSKPVKAHRLGGNTSPRPRRGVNILYFGEYGLVAALSSDGDGEKFSLLRSPAARTDGRIGQRRWVTFALYFILIAVFFDNLLPVLNPSGHHHSYGIKFPEMCVMCVKLDFTT